MREPSKDCGKSRATSTKRACRLERASRLATGPVLSTKYKPMVTTTVVPLSCTKQRETVGGVFITGCLG